MQIMLPIVKASEALKSLTQILMGFFDLVVPQYSCDDGNLFQTGLQNAPLTKRFCEHHLSLSWGRWLSGGSCLVGHHHTVFQSRVKAGHHAGLILTLSLRQSVFTVWLR